MRALATLVSVLGVGCTLVACGKNEPSVVARTHGGAAGTAAPGGEAGAPSEPGGGGGANGGAEASAGNAGLEAGGRAGSAGSAGTAGAAGDPFQCGPTTVAPVDETLIDDFTDSDSSLILPANGGRIGDWFTFSDGSAEATATLVAGRDGTGQALQVQGGPFTGWGAGIGFELSSPEEGKRCAYDVSPFAGVRFWVRGSGSFRATVQTLDVVPTSQGGRCAEGCWDSHTKQYTATEEWRMHELSFAALAQRGFGTAVPFDPRAVGAIQFEVDSPGSLELTLDDVEFYQSGAVDPNLPAIPGDAPYLDGTLSADARLADLLPRMSLREKIGQMLLCEQTSTPPANVTKFALGGMLSGGDAAPTPPTAEGWANLVDSYQAAALTSRLRIPLLYGVDAVHGVAKVTGATVFPHNIGMGATRDAALSEEEGAITAEEMAASGLRWTFAPALSVTRDQRWGRAYESYGEHPEIAALMSTYVRGLQGAAIPVLGTAKHYVGDGGAVWGTGAAMTGIDQGDAIMGESSLRAIHLAPYAPSIDLGVGSVMASFSSWNSGKLHANRYLLSNVLKSELDFGGFVVSDWNGIKQLSGSFEDQVRVSVLAGVDMFLLPSDGALFVDTLASLVNELVVPESRIDDAVSRIIRKKLELGLFESPLAARELIASVGSAEHRAVARRAVRESLVLLENTAEFLPLAATSTVCVNGSGADDLSLQVGGWTMGWQAPREVPQGTTIRAAIEELVGATNVVETGCDVGVRVVGERLGTYAEMRGDDPDPRHDDSGSCAATNGCVVVIVAGRPVDVQELLADPTTRALVMAWYPGSEGGGVADALYDVDGLGFVGKLPVTWKVDAQNEPVNYCTASPLDAGAELAMCGDVGEHYTDLGAPPPSVLFPYGFGLTR